MGCPVFDFCNGCDGLRVDRSCIIYPVQRAAFSPPCQKKARRRSSTRGESFSSVSSSLRPPTAIRGGRREQVRNRATAGSVTVDAATHEAVARAAWREGENVESFAAAAIRRALALPDLLDRLPSP